MKIERTIRRSQYITSTGVGAIYENAQESLIAFDTSHWPSYCETIKLQRLQEKVGAPGGFRKPPVRTSPFQKNPPKLRYLRFPRWLFCPNCRRMQQWSAKDEMSLSEKGALPRCGRCSKPSPVMIPMRFVAICPAGHLSDINWFKWAHSSAEVSKNGVCSYESTRLKFLTRHGHGSALKSMKVVCENCNAGRDLGAIMLPEELRKSGIVCSGRQPWQDFSKRISCKEMVRGEQRSSSNVYYPVTVSALAIPSATKSSGNSDAGMIEAHGSFKTLKQIYSAYKDIESPAVTAVAKLIADELDIDCKVVLTHIGGPPVEADEENLDNEEIEKSLLLEEWPALQGDHQDSEFVIAREPLDNSTRKSAIINNLMDQVMLVEKLREVRVFRGFNRFRPQASCIPADLTGNMKWLPAIEVFGEGIFLKFSEDKIQHWIDSQGSKLLNRLERMVARYEDADGLANVLPLPTAKFVMLHTFAHLLMRQLCFNCGYGSSSLRERIYASDSKDNPMSGVLIYTADSDAEGSLGGLVREGRKDRLASTIIESIVKSHWCSADPICRELPGQGLNGLNRAACHSCALVSETSCLFHNALLDRELVLGSGVNDTPLGFFAGLLDF